MKSGLIRILILAIVLTAVMAGPARAALCEEDACKVAMSNYFKFFSHLETNPAVKVRMEKVWSESIGGFGGPVAVFHVRLAKYHSVTLLKISDFMQYGIAADDGRIFAVENIENESSTYRKTLAGGFAAENIAGAKRVDYEKCASVIAVAGDEVLGLIAGGNENAAKNAETVLAGIAAHDKGLEPLVKKFADGLRSVTIMGMERK